MENSRVDGNEECEETNPPPVFLTLSEGDVVYIRGHGVCLASLAAGSPCPGFCTDGNVVIMRPNVRGGTGAGAPPTSCMFVTIWLGRQVDECLEWKLFSVEVRWSNEEVRRG